MATYTETYDFPDHKKGDTFLGIQFEVLINSAAVDLTGAVIKGRFKGQYGYNTYLLSTEASTVPEPVDGSITVTDATAGIFTVDNQVIDWFADTYDYDMQITLSSGEVYTFFEGTFTIEADITT